MKTATTCSLILLGLCSTTATATVTFDWATVGNPGNGPDDSGLGAVPYVFRISKYEVTNAQYTEFLNAADPTGTNKFALHSPSILSLGSGIIRDDSAANGAKYRVKSGRENNPVNYVSFFDAMRFTNWLENGQGSGSTESGVYRVGFGLDETRNPSATYFLPSRNEWYKAAYHKNDGVTGNYWDYATSTDAVPFSDQPPGSGAPTQSNTANFFKNDRIANGYDDGYAATGSTSINPSQNYLTDVGAYTASLSPYGTFDQGGNVWEWTETLISPSSARGLRGGSFSEFHSILSASVQSLPSPWFEDIDVGFRVAMIPEPSSLLLGLFGGLGLLGRRRRSG